MYVCVYVLLCYTCVRACVRVRVYVNICVCSLSIRGLCVRVWPPHTSDRRGGGGGCEQEGWQGLGGEPEGRKDEGKKKNTPLGTNTRVLSFWYRICFRIHLQYQDFESACRPIRCQAKEELSISHAGVRRESVCDEERERKRGFICAINR